MNIIKKIKERFTIGRKVLTPIKNVGLSQTRQLSSTIMEIMEAESRLEQIFGYPPEEYRQRQAGRATMLDASDWQKTPLSPRPGLDVSQRVHINGTVEYRYERAVGYLDGKGLQRAVALCHPSRSYVITRDAQTVYVDDFEITSLEYVEEEAIPAPNWPVRVPVEVERE